MNDRLLELDFLKGVMMILVVMFHLVILDVTYPTLRAAVYTFHVPIFMLISGYLSRVDKTLKVFRKGLFKLLLPYVIFETIYILMLYFGGTFMHSTNSVDSFTFNGVLLRLAAYPLGAYWYLHALIICSSVYYLVCHFLNVNQITKLLIVGLILYSICYVIERVGWAPITSGGGFVWESILYYLLGIYISNLEVSFEKVIPPSWLAIVPLMLLFMFPDNFHRGTLAGISITLLVMSFLMWVFIYVWKPAKDLLCYVGRNSLIIFVFSPIFTSFTKFAVPFFGFDPTIIIFTIVATCFIIMCSLQSAHLLDRWHLSKYLFGKEKVYVSITNL